MNIEVPTAGMKTGDSPGETTGQKERTVHIVIADGQSIFREGLCALLESESDFRIVGMTGDGLEALHLVKRLQPDLLLLDFAIPPLPGGEILRRLVHLGETTRCVVLTPANDRARLSQALEMGAHGVLSKEFPTEVLVHCIRNVMEGRYWAVNEAFSRREPALQSLMGTTGAPEGSPRFGLTKREMQVIMSVVAGYTNKEISQKFGISEDTVKHHLSNIFDKIGVYNRLELALFAVHHALIRKSEPSP